VPLRLLREDPRRGQKGGRRVKLVTYDSGSGPRVGALEDGAVVDLGFDGDMVDFVAAGAPEGERRPVGEARLLAPLRPRSMRDFLAFEGHLKGALVRLGRPIPDEWYEVPAYYEGMPDTVIGPDEEIPWPPWTERLDHELELAAVIGRRCRDVPAAEAEACIFGYTIWNDVSARDVQTRELPIGMGPGKAKDWDGSNVLGPCLVTADELDARGLGMRVRVNGEQWGEDSTAGMHWAFADMIAYASRSQTLYPGELLGSGTASGGSGLELDRALAPGDLVELEVDGIGVLRNRVGAKGEA
jgi:2-keto-4-pentenoate hydratase/2-oxohepta-3-ene-1,7-dioic acid hydratase in catechol pathway